MPKPNALLFFLFLLFFFNSGISQVVINEFSAANYDHTIDNFGEHEDWIELYNTTAIPQDLSGYHLSDKFTKPMKWAIPNGVIIGPNEHLLFWASGKDGLFSNVPHTNFKITQTRNSEAILFTDPLGNIIDSDSLNTPNQINHSQGRSVDAGSDWQIFTNPTPGTSNSNGNLYSPKPKLLPLAGFYNGPVTVSIENPNPNAKIYYTTNGQQPTNFSTLYTGPFTISQTSTVSTIAIAEDQNLLPSHIEYHTYFINEVHTLPVVAISGPLDDLMGGDRTSRPHGKFELFDDTGDRVAEVTGEFNKHGNDSWNYPQRGIDFISRDQFGDDYAVKYKVFPEYTKRDRFQRIILKAAANDNYHYENGAHIRDGYVHALAQRANMEMDARTYEPCILYVNGQYWGVYEMREKVDDHDYTEYYYDQKKKDIDFLKTWGATWAEYGSRTDWNALVTFIENNDMTNAGNYAYVEERLNVLSLIDYMILHAHIVSSDWLNWNTAWWRGRNPDGGALKWRYVLWDEDATFGHYINYTDIPTQSPLADPCNPELLDDPGGQGHIPMLKKLLKNEDFFATYINRYADLNNTFLNCDYMIPMLDEFIARIEPEMQRSINRWNGHMNGWWQAVNELRDFILDRCPIINNAIVDCYEDEGLEGPYNLTVNVFPENSGAVQINTAVGTNYPWVTTYFGGININLLALPETGWTFDHWEVGQNTFSPSQYTEAISMSLESNDVLTAFFTDACLGVTVDATILGEENFCPGASTMLVATDGFDDYLWSDGSDEKNLEVYTPGVYWVEVTNDLGCRGRDSIIITQHPEPLPLIIGPLSFCAGGSSGLSAGNFQSYLWSTNEMTSNITVSNPGIYQVTVTDINNCTASTQAEVTVLSELTPSITGPASICSNSDNELQVDSYTSYLWSTNEATQFININSGGTYSVTVTDDNNCTGTSTFEVTELPELTPVIEGENSFCANQSTQLSSGTFASYFWSTAEITSEITVTESGTYTLTVTDDSGCTGTTFIEVTENNVVQPEISGSTSICFDGSTTLELTNTFENYLWSNNATGEAISVNAPGSYSVVVTDTNGCTGMDQVEITESDELTPIINGHLNFCANGETILSVSDFETYLWSTTNNTPAITVEQSGIYAVTVSDINGCTGTSTVEVIENDLIIPEIIGSTSFCPGSNTTLEVDGNFENYNWSTNESSESILINTPGLYSVVVTDQFGCTGTDATTVILSDELSPVISGVTAFCNGENTTLSVADFNTYQWSTNESISDIIVDQSGTYSVTVSDDNGCTGSANIDVVENDLVLPEITGSTSFCPGGNTTLSVAPGFENYAWSNNATGESILINSPGIYSIIVSDALGCSGTDQVEVLLDDELSPIITGDLTFCEGSQTTLSVADFNTYQWSNNQSEASITINTPGQYSITVTDVNNCIGAASVMVNQVANPIPTIFGNPKFCEGSSTELFVDPYVNIDWSNNINGSNNEIFAPGIYSVTVTDANNCVGENVIEVSVNENPIPEITGPGSICIGSTALLAAGDFENYFWSNNSEAPTITVDMPGSYGVTVTDNNNCSGTDHFELIETDALIPGLTGNFGICPGGFTTIQAGLFNSYQWSNNLIEQQIEISSPGNYTITVTDDAGCTGTESFQIELYPIPDATITGPSNLCANVGAALQAESGYAQYEWNDASDNDFLLINGPGEYSLTVTNAEGCTASEILNITENFPVATQSSTTICYGGSYQGNIYYNSTSFNNSVTGSNGCDSTHTVNLEVLSEVQLSIYDQVNCANGNSNVTANAVGGDNNFTYLWSNNAIGVYQENLPAGNYSVTATDNFGCSAEQIITIENYDPIQLDYSIEHISCFGENDGVIELDISGGLEPYFVTIQNEPVGFILENLAPGEYILNIKDANGCSFFKSIEIGDPGIIKIDINTTLANNGANGTALAGITGGTAPYTYQWSNGGTGVFQENLSPGNYTLTITDSNGCISVEDFVIEVSSAVNEIIEQQQLIIFPNPNDGNFNIKMDGWNTREAGVKVYDIFGRMVLSEKLKTNHSDLLSVKLGGINSGTYFVVVDSEEGRMIGELIVVQ